jgi:hypothetical protein
MAKLAWQFLQKKMEAGEGERENAREKERLVNPG